MRTFHVRSFYTKILIFILLSVALLESLLLVFDSSPEEVDGYSNNFGKSLSSYSSPSSPSPSSSSSSFSGFFSLSQSSEKRRDEAGDLDLLHSYFDKAIKKGEKEGKGVGGPSPPSHGSGGGPPKEQEREKQKEAELLRQREQREREEKARKEERERLEKERLEKERLEKERLEKERLEKLEKERLEKLEKERLEKLEKERLEQEQRKAKEEEQKRAQLQNIGLPKLDIPSFSVPLDPFKSIPIPTKPPVTDGKTKPTNILSKSTSPGDSVGFRFMEDPRFYSLCHFKTTCVNSTSYMIIVKNEQERNYYTSQLEYCGERSQRRMDLCGCFTKQLAPVFVTADSVAQLPKKSGHWWVSDKWVFGHQISHWAEKLVNMHSVMQKWDSYSLPQIEGIAFLKDPLPMTDHEQAIYEISVSALSQKVQTMWLSDFEATGGFCFEQTTMSSLTATIATSPADANKFRENAYKYFDLEMEECPPPKAMLLYRTEPLNRRRMILNLEEVEALMKRYGIKTFEKVTVGADTTSQEQANIFAQYGLILSSHSSQLVNTLFSQPNSAVVEIVPAFFNYDFGEMANQMGLKYMISLGGEAPNLPFPKEASECQESFAECHGEGTCFAKLQRTLRQTCMVNGTPYKDYSVAVKHLDFKADISILEASLKKALDHLHQSCGGRWGGVQADF